MANTLEYLDCSYYHRDSYIYKWGGVNQNGISDLKKLRTLFCNSNGNIHDVNHLSGTLEVLGCSGHIYYHIDQYGISKLKFLRELYAKSNQEINNVKGKNLFSLQPSTTTMVSCKSSV